MTQLKLEVEEALASTVRNSTAQYGIFVSCNKCAGVHETGISITMEDGPVEKHKYRRLLQWEEPSKNAGNAF